MAKIYFIPKLNLLPATDIGDDAQPSFRPVPFKVDTKGRVWFDPGYEPERLEIWTDALADHRRDRAIDQSLTTPYIRARNRPALNIIADGFLRRLETVVYCAVERICLLMMIGGGGKKVKEVWRWRSDAKALLAADLHALPNAARKNLIAEFDDGETIKMRGLWWPTSEDGNRTTEDRFARLESLYEHGRKRNAWERMYPQVKKIQPFLRHEVAERFSPAGRHLTGKERIAIENEILFQVALVRSMFVVGERARRLSQEWGDFQSGITKHGSEHSSGDRLYRDAPSVFRPEDVLLAAYSGMNPAFIFMSMSEMYEEFETMRGLGCLRRQGEFEFSPIHLSILAKYMNEIADHDHTGCFDKLYWRGAEARYLSVHYWAYAMLSTFSREEWSVVVRRSMAAGDTRALRIDAAEIRAEVARLA